ncbi:MAG: PQQ-binding-like beta-propeller repeat protein [Peptococcaceae bacterium]|nr:PQQ-binding-like beta-propeller repeat protein [Peptococcaceae bacterium]
MRRAFLCLLASLLILAGTARQAWCGGHDPRVVWKVAGLGKAAAEIQLGPNGLLYLPCGNKLVVIDHNGKKLWEASLASGTKPDVFDGRGSIFMSGKSLVQEMKINGGTGWNLTVGQAKSGSAWIVPGPEDLLYLALPTALYALDVRGDCQWVMPGWESEDFNRSLTAEDRQILAIAGNSKYVFAVHGRKGKGFRLTAVNGRGEIAWNYYLGELKSAHIEAGGDGRIYVTANPDKVDNYIRGKVCVFESEGKTSPVWTYQVRSNDISAPVLTGRGIVYFSAGQKLFALDQANGTELWTNLFNKKLTRPAVDEATGRVYLGTDGETLLAVDPGRERLDWSLSLDGKVSTPPAVIGGHIYVISDKGTVYKIKDEYVSSDTGVNYGE